MYFWLCRCRFFFLFLVSLLLFVFFPSRNLQKFFWLCLYKWHNYLFYCFVFCYFFSFNFYVHLCLWRFRFLFVVSFLSSWFLRALNFVGLSCCKSIRQCASYVLFYKMFPERFVSSRKQFSIEEFSFLVFHFLTVRMCFLNICNYLFVFLYLVFLFFLSHFILFCCWICEMYLFV